MAAFLHDKTFEAVAAELAQTVQKDNGRATRLYLIAKAGKDKINGRFIVGKRKASPWQGFGTATFPEALSETVDKWSGPGLQPVICGKMSAGQPACAR